VGEVLADAHLDLAAIPVESNLEAEHRVRFFDLGAGGTTPPEGHTIVVMGFPYDISSPSLPPSVSRGASGPRLVRPRLLEGGMT